jgi:hypothetical protein
MHNLKKTFKCVYFIELDICHHGPVSRMIIRFSKRKYKIQLEFDIKEGWQFADMSQKEINRNILCTG